MKTLIQLVSEQTMPNLLPAMAIQPERIVHLCTPQMQSVSNHLVRAYNAAGVHTTVDVVPLTKMPGLKDTAGVMNAVFQEYESPVVNFTGGTKLMSIAAYATAFNAKKTSLYVDTTSGCFVDGGTGSSLVNLLPDGNDKLDVVVNRLSVEIIAIANGVERVTQGRDWNPFVDVARQFLLLDESVRAQCIDFGHKLLAGQPQAFQVRRNWFPTVYQRPAEGIPDIFRQGLVDAGLFEWRNGHFFPNSSWVKPILQLPRDPDTWTQLVPALEMANMPFKFLESGWWEVAVADYYERVRGGRGVLWDADAGSQTTKSTNLEEDVLGVMGTNLLYVSCKLGRMREKLSGWLEEANSRGSRIGGSFARKVLAVFYPQSPFQFKRLKNRCAELRMEYLDGQTVRAALP